jgi:hypothetical protein
MSLDSNHLIYLNLMSILGGSMPLALYAFGLFSKPADDPANAGFHELSDLVLQAVDGAQGLIACSGYASDGEGASWGLEVYPSFNRERGDFPSPTTPTLWRDLESLFFYIFRNSRGCLEAWARMVRGTRLATIGFMVAPQGGEPDLGRWGCSACRIAYAGASGGGV